MDQLDLTDLHLDPSSPTPPFEQVRAHVAGLVAGGELPAGTRLPTVRALAETLGLAVNTVARVYRELEADGLVVTEGRRGTFVARAVAAGHSGSAPSTPHEEVAAHALTLATDYARAARRLGLTRAEATRLVEDAWTTG